MQTFLRYFIALVWLINGLFCKVLDLVPRHQQIVAVILGEKFAPSFTIAIGLAEIFMFVWILSRKYAAICTWLQVGIVLIMNVIEFVTVPHLLLFGRLNIVFAAIFIALVLYHYYGSFRKKY